jgi:gliding motility-associated-like protein
VLPGNIVPFFFTLLKNLCLMKYFILSILLWPALLWAQPSAHNNIWYFGCGHTVQFTPAGPVAGAGIPAVPLHNLYSLHSSFPRGSIAVCNELGDLQFFMQVKFTVTATSDLSFKPKVFDRNGQPMPNGDIPMTYNDHGSGNPLVVPHAGNSLQYYLFYVKGNALYYSLVDMGLNGGLGDIVSNEKDIQLTPLGSVIGTKITLIRGCRQTVWLVARSRIANDYYSFAIGSQGISPTPVISEVGSQPLLSYRSVGNYHGGVLTASNNGRLLAAGTPNGIELYDFEQCSGRVKNARMLDTLRIMGLCFSPDDTKLYASSMERWSLWNDNPPIYSNYVPLGRVYQYDLLQSDPLLSRTQLLENPVKVCLTLAGYTDTVSSWIGDIKCGVDNKLYVASNTKPCNNLTPVGAIPVPPSTNVVVEQVLHCVHQPNQPGLASMPEHNAVILQGSPVLATGFMLPQEIVPVPQSIPDTLAPQNYNLVQCFDTILQLQANTAGACYEWDDGSTEPLRTVRSSGKYWVRYFEGCSLRIDSFDVQFVPLPILPQLLHACPHEGVINIAAVDSHTVYTYTLNAANGETQKRSGAGAQQFTGLAQGNYQLQISTGSCDTILDIEIATFPKPELVVQPTDTTIYYGAALQLHASGAQWYVWSPSAHLDTATIASPLAQPLKPTLYEVIGINEYGCRDTAYSRVHINYDMPDFVPNAFSPNGDGLNDVFRPVGITYQKLSVFKVFNRYGNEVYSGTDPAQGWDGSYKGKPCEAGTYYYLIALVYPDGRTQSYKGDLTLIR